MRKAVPVLLCFAVASCGDGESTLIQVPDPDPCHVGSVPTPGFSTQVTHSAGYAYVYVYEHGLQVFDLHDPAKPSSLPGVELENPEDFVLSGDYLFASGSTGLSIFSIADPAKPERVGFQAMDANGLAVDAERAYVGGALNNVRGLHIIDLATPSSPVLMSTMEFPATPTSVAVSGHHAYLGVSREGFYVLDVANPLAPVLVAHLDIPGYLHEARIIDGHVFVLSYQNAHNPLYPGNDALWAIDVQVADTPLVVGVLTLGAYPTRQVHLRGSWAYLARGQQEVQVLDLGHPESPQIARTISVPDMALGLWTTEEHLLVTDHGALHVIDGDCGWQNGSRP